MRKKVSVALLSGGTSSERDISIKGGDYVYSALDKSKYNVIRYDPSADIPKLFADAPQIDVALVILHGSNGEDGTVQGLLDLLHIPYQCSGPLGSAVAMHKLASKRLYESADIRVPAYMGVNRNSPVDIAQYVDRIGLPLVVKPASSGSSIGMSIVREAGGLADALENAFAFDETILLEEYISGVEITGAVLGNDALEALPIVEIVPQCDHEYFDFTAKYTAGETREICPARISGAFTNQARELACKAHQALFCKGCSRTDMILCQDRIYVLETNTIPGMTSESLLPLAAKTRGMTFEQLLDRLIELGLERRQADVEKGRDI
ncbi:MAG: D-alanine--D-alanine ligase [Desulfobacterales bacterium]|nr:D-alanine--D-alanine ligase [Desulfobacterales bacterium]